jgi:hypothetical protein
MKEQTNENVTFRKFRLVNIKKTVWMVATLCSIVLANPLSAQHRQHEGGRDEVKNRKNDAPARNERDRNPRNVNNNQGTINQRTTIINQKTVVGRSTPNWKYAALPRRNAVFNAAPTSSLTVNFGGINFRYDRGIYYKPYRNTFMVAAAPIGIRVRQLPIDYRVVMVYNRPYYYYNGTYYENANQHEYVVVAPPVGALVESIPDNFQELVINGDTYYIVDGVQYRATLYNNEIWYEVIKNDYR